MEILIVAGIFGSLQAVATALYGKTALRWLSFLLALLPAWLVMRAIIAGALFPSKSAFENPAFPSRQFEYAGNAYATYFGQLGLLTLVIIGLGYAGCCLWLATRGQLKKKLRTWIVMNE